jgi:hypothetical protein
MDERNEDELQNEEIIEDEFLDDEEEEISHSDKLVGLFSEPSNIFARIAQAPIKVTDWLIPLLVFIVVLSLSTVIMQTNPQIKYSMMEKQTEAIEQNFSEAVNSGRMTQEQADSQIEIIRERMEQGGMAMLIPQIIGIVIFTFLVFFIISGFYYGITRLILKGDGTYGNAMVAYGLPFYIASVQVIFQVIVAMLMNKMVTDLSVTTFLDLDKQELLGFLLSKLDVFTIWFYVVVGIAFAKMFKSEETTKYVGMILGLWLGFSFLFFYLAKTFSFMKYLGM